MPDKTHHGVQPPGDLATTTEEEEHLSMSRDEVPEGPIRSYPDARRSRRFAFAIPILLLMIGLAFLAEVAVVVVGYQGALRSDYELWYAGIPILTMISVAVGAWAANGGWLRDRKSGPGRPIVYGFVAALGTAFTGFAVLSLITAASA